MEKFCISFVTCYARKSIFSPLKFARSAPKNFDFANFYIGVKGIHEDGASAHENIFLDARSVCFEEDARFEKMIDRVDNIFTNT